MLYLVLILIFILIFVLVIVIVSRILNYLNIIDSNNKNLDHISFEINTFLIDMDNKNNYNIIIKNLSNVHEFSDFTIFKKELFEDLAIKDEFIDDILLIKLEKSFDKYKEEVKLKRININYYIDFIDQFLVRNIADIFGFSAISKELEL